MKTTPLFKPYVSYRAIYYVVRTLLGTQLAEGSQVKQFEKEFSEKFNQKNVVALNSGTSALELAYELAGIKEGDEVITPCYTCTATNLPLVRRGAKIIFSDIEDDLNISIEDVKKKYTNKTKAVVFVHMGGNNRGLKELVSFCKKRGIILIEDAAQAVGSDYWGKADFTCTSTQAIKLLTSGDGGFLMCKKKSDYEKAKRLRWFGIDRPKKQKVGDVDVTEAGFKFHMSDVTGAIGLGNLRSIDKVIAHRKELIKIYESYGLQSNIWLTRGHTEDYNKTKEVFAKNGIDIGQHHYKNYKYSIFKKYAKGDSFPNMERLQHRHFFVPHHYGVSFKDAHRIGRIYHSL